MPHEKPRKKEIKVFFEHLNRKGLSPDKLEKTIERLDTAQIYDYAAEYHEMLSNEAKQPTSVPSFVANSSLSGLPHPCINIECRLRRVDQVARFASLYADKVLVQDPFSHFIEISHASQTPLDYHYYLKRELRSALSILHYLRPLLEKELVDVAATRVHMCPECYKKFVQDTHFDQASARIRRFLEREYTHKVRYSVEMLGGVPVVKKTGPEELVEHSVHYSSFVSEDVRQFLDKHSHSAEPYRLSRSEVKNYGVLESCIAPLMDDFFIQNAYAELFDTHYLTDRDLDFKMISEVNDLETNTSSKALIKGLSHSVPFIQDVELPKLVELREKEGESFRVYRDALRSALGSVTGSDVRLVEQVFNDIVRPELNAIDLTIKNSRRLLWGSLTQDFLFGAGFVGIGLFSGLLPPNIGEVMATLGGFKFVSGSLEKASKLLQDPPEVRENRYYFLWRVRQEARRKS